VSALGRLGPVPDRAGLPVAFQGGEVLRRAQFDLAVGGMARRLSGCSRIVLACRDSWAFAVGLMGGLAAGAEVALPANDLPATLASLDGLVVDDGFEAAPAPWDAALPADARLLFHTSGSTGEPKTITRTLAQMSAEIDALDRLWGAATDGAATLATVPHQHAYGLVFKLLWPLAAGRPFHAARHELWEEILDALPAGAVLVTSPAHLARMGGLAPLAPARRPRMVLSAGAPLSAEAASEARRVLGVAVTEIYGSTETGAVATRSRHGADPAWTPLPSYRVASSAEGLLRVDSAAATADLADRVVMEGDGGFRLLGRADRIAKIDGKRVALDEVERALASCPQVAAAAAVVLDDPDPVLAALVVPSEAGRAELERLGAFRMGRALRRGLSDRLEAAGLPRRWRFVDDLPVGPMGKCLPQDLRALFRESPCQPEILAEQRDEDKITLTLSIPKNLRWFQGHFPGRPILPGVVQLDWAVQFARLPLGVELAAATQFQIKFKAVIEPGDVLDLELRHDVARGRLAFAYRRGGQECSSGTVYLP